MSDCRLLVFGRWNGLSTLAEELAAAAVERFHVKASARVVPVGAN